MTFIVFTSILSLALHAYIYFSLRIKLENALVSLREIIAQQGTVKKHKIHVIKKTKKKMAEQLTI